MELRQVRYFCVLAESLRFHEASRELRIAQPSLSVQIKQLEDEVGFPLLLRGPKNNQLTPAGVAFLAKAKQILALAENAPVAARKAAEGEAGTLRLGFVPASSLSVLPDMLQDLRRALPQINLELQELPSAKVLAGVQSGVLDLGLTQASRPYPHLQSLLLHREKLVVALARNHPLATKRSVSPRDLRNDVTFLPGAHLNPVLNQTMLDAFGADGLLPHSVQVVEQIHTVLILTAERMGITLIPASAARLKIAGLVYRPLRGTAHFTDLVALWRPEEQDALLRKVLEVVRSRRIR